MRRRGLLAGVLVAGLVLAGCAGGEGAAPSATPASAFPVTITHGQGTVTIPAAPRRVVVLGTADTQIAAALGAPIVGATTNPSSPDGAWLGVNPQVPAEIRTLDSIRPNIEAIAALRPDLILMTSAQPSFSAAYEQIAAIAPTISYRTALLQDSGVDLTRLIGQALGKDAEAEQLIRDSDARLAAYRSAHPGLDGRTYAFGQYTGGANYLVVAPDGPTAKMFAGLGLHQPPELASMPIWQAGIAQVAPESLGALATVDTALIGVASEADGQAFAAQPLLARSALVRDGKVHFLTFDQAGLMLQPNPATTATVLEVIGPLLPGA